MREWWEVIGSLAENAVFILTVIIFTTYLTLMIFSAISLRRYLRKNSYVDYNSIITSPIAPTLSVIAPAYNESATIVDNIRTLLSLYYNNYEIVVVNDGSTDDSMEKITEAYELEKVNYYFDYILPCERIRGVYKSKNRSFKKLLVVDKRNGGKADALNAGLNVTKNDLVVCIDADSIMEQDALLKLVKPFLEEKEKKVIGAGGVIRIANSCDISGGHINKVHLPKKWLPRAQVLEYTRAFLLGRMAWSELDGLLLISGALGMFNREIVIQAGGYSTKTVGEDMELVVRIRRYMAERNLDYKVEYIPDPLCWTEVPSDLKNLARQRSRWTRGTIETLYTHRKLFFNRKYGKLGTMGYPYWLFFEWMAPIVEFIGILWFATLAIMGRLNVPFFLLLLGFVYFFSVSLSIWSVLFEEITFHKYEKRRDVLKLILTAFLEPFFYHPVVLVMNIKGNIDKLLKKNTWGKMEREGFSKKGRK
ncbi:MAG: glycosyltransferase [Bacteroidales bacterium]